MNDLPEADKDLGQHWLTDELILQEIVDFADISAEDVVLEIGPGTGTLTDVLAETGADILALEFDSTRASALHKKYADKAGGQIRIKEGDIRKYDLAALPEKYKIVANIPYYLTANLCRKLVDDSHKPASATLLVQKEVAERIAAKPGQLSLIAVLLQLWYEIELGPLVAAEFFTPPPKVDSQVVRLSSRGKFMFDAEPEELYRVIKAGFSQKRKKLSSSLNHGLGTSKEQAAEALKRADIHDNARAQELSLQQWYKLTQTLDNRA